MTHRELGYATEGVGELRRQSVLGASHVTGLIASVTRR